MPRKVKQQSIAPMIMIGAGVVLILSLLIWLAVSNKAASTTNAGQELPYPEVARISLQDSKAAFDQKSALFLDVRDADSFAAGHIPGAVNIPLATLENRVGELKTDQWIITYCT